MIEFPNFIFFLQQYQIFAGIAIAIVHIAFMLAIYSDASRRNTFLVSAYIWALATLFGGLSVVAIYWVIHYSNLRSQD